MNETISTFAIPLAIYLIMGMVTARIQLESVKVKSFNTLRWMQFAVDALRIVFLWPLVLFIDKSKGWLEKTAGIVEAESSLSDSEI